MEIMENPFGQDSDEKSDPGRRELGYSEIASKLIRDRLWLTALELHAELVESGREVKQLKEFFSNPVNFESNSRMELLPGIPRSSSQATLDSLDMTRFSEDGERMNDERVAVLEFELRKARETISALRSDLTVATTEGASASGSSTQTAPIKPHEQRALNFLINEYLLSRHVGARLNDPGAFLKAPRLSHLDAATPFKFLEAVASCHISYKLTSITFADENEEQDFEDWDDVGLNMPKPPELLHLYRVGLRETHSSSEDIGVQTEISSFEPIEELIASKKTFAEQSTQCEKIDGTRSDISGSFEELHQSEIEGPKHSHDVARVELEKSKLSLLQETIDHDTSSREDAADRDEDDDPMSDKGKSVSESGTNIDQTEEPEVPHEPDCESTPDLNSSPQELCEEDLQDAHPEENSEESAIIDSTLTSFENEVWSLLSTPKVLQCIDRIGHDVLVRYLGRSLQSILTQLPVNNKEWLAKVVPLLVCMIALHPNEKTKDDFIHCLLNLKKRPSQEDRNVIIAGVVGLCRRQKSDDSLTSQLLSQCWELMADKYPERRVLVAQMVAHLSRLIAPDLRDSLLLSMLKQLMEDRDETVRAQSLMSLAALGCSLVDEKYSEFESLVLKGLLDRSDNVVNVVSRLLLPVAAKISLDRLRFHKTLVPNLLFTLNSVNSKEKENKLCNVLSGFIQILPHLVMYTAASDHVIQQIRSSLPPPQQRIGFTDICKGLSSPPVFYDQHPIGSVIGSFDYCLSQSMDWPELNWIVNDVLPTLLDSLDQVEPSCEQGVLSFAKLFGSLTAGFGTIFTTQYVKAAFLDRLELIEKSLLRGKELPSFWVITVYLISVLAPLHSCEEELGTTVGRLLIMLGVSSAPLACLQLALSQLASCQRLTNTLLSALWQGVVHQRPSVRVATCSLFTKIVPHVPEHVVSSRVIPALVTLGSDSEVAVKVATLPVYALALQQNSKNKEFLDKSYLQIQSVLTDSAVAADPTTMVPIVSALSDMNAHADSYLREQLILVELHRLVNAAFDLEQGSPFKAKVTSALVDCLSNVIFLQLSKNSIVSTLLPTLRVLESLCKEAVPTLTEAATGMLREVEARAGLNEPPLRSPTSPTSLGAAGVEEMRAKMTKMFNAAPKPAGLSSLGDIFRKNKP